MLIYGLTSAGRGDTAKLVAYDKATGATIAEVPLPAAPLGTPMTYAIGGRQFIAVTLTNGTMVSLALPTRS